MIESVGSTELANNVVYDAINQKTLRSHEKRFKWFAINTNPRCEDIVCSILKRDGFEVLLPKVKNSRKNKTEPLFPGYLFVRLDLSLSNWVKIKYMHGVRKILSQGDALIPIPEKIITVIKCKNVDDNTFLLKALSLKEGDKVRFLKGPFEGLEGEYSGEVSGNDRVKILLKAIEHWAFKVEAEAHEISKIG